ncbi:ROK family protein [Nonomuraea sp. NPDC003727]|uniref:ROK family protein n=1 Tax=Nonomuraea sp. NPDC003804 TaxID=3154547 RepID=UPI0033B75459
MDVGDLRVHNRLRLLRAVHDCAAGRTRSQLTRDLALARGTASVLVAGLVEDELLQEAPPREHARGRPTQVPGPHPDGPLALAADLREDTWTIAAGELGGGSRVLATRGHDGTPGDALPSLGAALRERLGRLGPRVVGVGLSAAGPVRADGMLDISHLGWVDVDVAQALALGDVPLLVGNDARLAGLAEARRGHLRGVDVGLHIHVDFDPGGALLVEGRPLTGAGGTAGEFGHMPLAGGDEPCPCGARGCLSLAVGRNALLRHLGLEAGRGRGRDQAEGIVAAAAAGDPAAVAAIEANAAALGRGIGALVNALDPGTVTVSGIGVALVGERLRRSCDEALMELRRRRPPAILPSALADTGPLVGAMESVFDAFLTPDGLEIWHATRPKREM